MTEFPNTPPELLPEIRDAMVPLQGWTTPERGFEMADAIFETRPKIVVEIGVFGGRSLVAQALAMRASGHGGLVVGIDPWRKEAALEGENEDNRKWWTAVDIEKVHRDAVNAIWSRNLQSHCVIIRSASQHVASLFPRVDMLFIDGNHAMAMRDVEMWGPKVPPGGYIFADDADWNSTQFAYNRLKEMADVVNVGDEIVDGVHRKGHYLVLRKRA
jgi:predicted O-methyltransferase YrrM